MGIYLNPANNGYSETKNGKVFVDKSLLIDYTNQVIKTPQKNICVSSVKPQTLPTLQLQIKIIRFLYFLNCNRKLF